MKNVHTSIGYFIRNNMQLVAEKIKNTCDITVWTYLALNVNSKVWEGTQNARDIRDIIRSNISNINENNYY